MDENSRIFFGTYLQYSWSGFGISMCIVQYLQISGKDWLDADSSESIVPSKATRVHSKRLSVQEFFLRMAALDADPLANEESRIKSNGSKFWTFVGPLGLDY